MKTNLLLLAASAFCVVGIVQASYSVNDKGTWPGSWPREMEPLRKQSRTFTGPIAPQPHYEIPFADRKEFEAAWPHILEVKSKGAPVILVRGPSKFPGTKAGVWISCPPPQKGGRPMPEEPLAGVTRTRERWMYTTFIELIVDGNVVDLNRIRLPADTPIIDERFADEKSK